MMSGFAFVNDDDVSRWIKCHGHVADGCLEGLHFELHICGFEGGDGGIKIYGFQATSRAIGAR